MKFDRRILQWAFLLSAGAALFLSLGINQKAQTQKLPAPSGHVNDFAGVLNETTRQQLENLLAGLKSKTGIEFDIATVTSAEGQDISDYSLQLAKDWNVGSRNSSRKSLLLVLAINEKTAFTRFSRTVQGELPEGVLGEMGQRMRPMFEAGQFSEGLVAGVEHFVSSLANKRGLSAAELTSAPATTEATQTTEAKAPDEAPPALNSSTPETKPATETVRAPNTSLRNRTAAGNPKPYIVGDDDESEQVELTLTLPAEARVAKLKAFLDSRPDSKLRPRATELLVSSRAALGDEKLKKGDSAGGIEQLLLAIADAPTNASERLFSGVISQIPLNLYLRGEPTAATKAAQEIEAKFGSDAKHLVALSGSYVRMEQGDEAVRLAKKAVELSPDLAEAHQGLGSALHVSLRLDEALAEFKRAVELDPTSKLARRGVADLSRALGKTEEALAVYRQQIDMEPTDKVARNGMILSLLDLGRVDEAKVELEKALKAEPRNVNLLAGAAYWFAAHNDTGMALDLGRQAVEIEPRYTWAQIAVARALLAQNKPVEAERAIRFARQYGRFPTLDYELASALVSASLYDEAAEVLMQSFSFKDGQIETRLGGQAVVRNDNFVQLLARERQASIFQSAAADSEGNAKRLKALLAFATVINSETDTTNEGAASAAAKEFASGDDASRVHRQLYAASRLLRRGVGYQTAFELSEAARDSAEAGMNVPALTLAVQADEFRSIRARAIAAGGTPDVPDAPRNVLSSLLRGRIEDVAGWALFNQDKLDQAADHLKRAVAILPEGTPAAQTALWRLGATLERQDKTSDALSYYIKSYNAGEPDPVRRTIIERLYRKVNGSLDGLDERIGPAPAASSAVVAKAATNVTPLPEQITTPSPVPEPAPVTDTASAPTPTPLSEAPATAPETSAPAPSPEAPAATPETAAPTASPEATPATSPEPTSEPTPQASPEASPTPESQPTPTPASSSAPPATSSLAASPVETMNKPKPTTITIVGHVKDSKGAPVADVVVVLISPQGTVLASTTDEQGKFSFTIVPSSTPRSYRIIPSKEGFAFEPVDRVLPVANDDVKELDFVARSAI